eukprot:Clim_evm31s142 gene=Clim_evmTU31s142
MVAPSQEASWPTTVNWPCYEYGGQLRDHHKGVPSQSALTSIRLDGTLKRQTLQLKCHQEGCSDLPDTVSKGIFKGKGLHRFDDSLLAQGQGSRKRRRVHDQGNGLAAVLADLPILRGPSISKENFLAQLKSSNKLSSFDPKCVRCISWHPNDANLLAVAFADDSVWIYDWRSEQHVRSQSEDGVDEEYHTLGGPSARPLRDVRQSNIISLAWRPTSRSILAVGCPAGVILWRGIATSRTQARLLNQDDFVFDGDKSSLGSKLINLISGSSAGSAIATTDLDGACVTSLSWSPDGRLLAGASPLDTSIHVWNLSLSTVTGLRCAGITHGFSQVLFTQDGTYLWATGSEGDAASWPTATWDVVRWNTHGMRITSIAGVEGTSSVIVTYEKESYVYLLGTDVPQAGTRCDLLMDLSKHITPNVGDGIGVIPVSLAVNNAGNRLAVILSSGGREDDYAVALFSISVTDGLTRNIQLIGLVGAPEGATGGPRHISFTETGKTQPRDGNGAARSLTPGKFKYDSLDCSVLNVLWPSKTDDERVNEWMMRAVPCFYMT